MKRTKLKRKYNELSNPGKNTNQDNNTHQRKEKPKNINTNKNVKPLNTLSELCFLTRILRKTTNITV